MAHSDASVFETARADSAFESAGLGVELVIPTEEGVRAVKLSEGREYSVGRGLDADIHIAHASVSRKHASLRVTDGVLHVRDLKSSNGTRVLGKRLPDDSWVEAPVGSVVEIGSVSIAVRERNVSGDAAVARAAVGTPTMVPPPFTGEGPGADAADRILLDPAMEALDRTVALVAPTPLAVLILGETGVGKEGLAASIHERSLRAGRPFLKLNCAALPESILDGELFGYERGAFTGAVQAKAGLFEAADGGTVFLDEVGELPLSTQAKLLRVLESGEVLRLGSRTPKRVDIRCVAATNRDLQGGVVGGTFRGDLFFRLAGVVLRIPPLRDRADEILPLARLFIALAAKKIGLTTPRLSAPAADVLLAHSWPGNVRELRNAVERATVLATRGLIEPEHLILDTTMMSASRIALPTDASTGPGPVFGGAAAHAVAQGGRGSARDASATPVSSTAASSTIRSATGIGDSAMPPVAGYGTLGGSRHPAETTMTGFVLAGSGLPTVADGTPLPPSAADSGPTSETFAIAGEGAPLSAASDRADETIRSLNESLRSAERTRILEALQRSGGNQRLAAAELGISRFTLMKRMEQYGIVRPRKR